MTALLRETISLYMGIVIDAWLSMAIRLGIGVAEAKVTRSFPITNVAISEVNSERPYSIRSRSLLLFST